MTTSCCGKTAPVIEQIETVEETQTEIQFLQNKETNAAARLDICRGCENLSGTLNMCSLCGCFMNIKVRIYSAKCPAGKW